VNVGIAVSIAEGLVVPVVEQVEQKTLLALAAENARNIQQAQEVKDGRLVVENAAGAQELALSPDDLVEYEWAWRTNALKPQSITSIQAPFVYMSLWDDEAEKSYPALKNEILHLYWSEPLDLPAGQFQAQKSTLGGQSAWYVKDHAGPVRIDDGMLIYELEK
ncbi:MAG: 2-oxo acid dehydrogenase subunit E2, partial [Chloroflexi bacterium]|nr:2-oxo acid dehydrogenase subunit E2 [Chloroflexota bacterium]